MKLARKSNRVSWAPGPNLCQVKLFSSEDCPSKVGRQSQDHLQAKTWSMLPTSSDEYDDLPPGFEDNHFLNQSKAELSHISQIKWQCPPAFAFSSHWRVAAGEESKEKEYQKLRERRVLEAVYPRLSAIPPSPFVSFEVEKADYDDNLTASIPIIPIEEEESMDLIPEVGPTKLAVTPSKLQSQNMPQHTATCPINSRCKPSSATVPSYSCEKPATGMSPWSEADLTAASAVVAAIVKSNDQGSLIDMDLLLRIFNDPIMIERLINEHRTAAATVSASSNTVGIPTSELKPVTSSGTSEGAASGNRHTSAMGLLPASGPKQPTQSESSLTPTPDKPATPSVPLFRPVAGKSAPAPHMHRPANKNIPHMSNGRLPTLNTQSPQQDTVLSSGVKQAATLASICSSELSTVALPSASVNLNAVTNHVQSPARTVPHQSGTGSPFAVKDANYYKNLIRQHGADKQDMLDSQIGIHYNNFQDLKTIHNIIKPGEMVFKTQKPCIYFKSPRGCRNGSNCPYKHDMSVQFEAGNVLAAQSAKRMKLGPEIKGCT